MGFLRALLAQPIPSTIGRQPGYTGGHHKGIVAMAKIEIFYVSNRFQP
jgi:hypothetical protein